MKKADVLQQISSVRRSCEIANSNLRSTANTFDTKAMQSRPTTEDERRRHIVHAWAWIMDARKKADAASTMLLKYAKQNGLTVEDIDQILEETP